MNTVTCLFCGGIDARELGTAGGRKALDFVERKLAKVPFIFLTSSRSDKYDRYLADVFYLRPGNRDRTYLNQELLDHGLAVRM